MNDTYDRREFLIKQARWAAAAGLMGNMTPALFAQSPAPQGGAKVITRTLGKTGLTLPIVNMGVMTATVPGLLRKAYELGIRYFDTAATYQGGRSEEMVGAMMKEMGARDQVIISTKVHLYPGQTGSDTEMRKLFRQNYEKSLKRLQMEYVDILYYHNVSTVEGARAEAAIQVLTELKKEGKIRFTGISIHGGDPVLREAVRLGAYDVGIALINYTMASNKGLLDAIDQAARAGMGIVAAKTQAGGLSRPDRNLPRALPPHSQSALLKWVLRNPSITTAIPGATAYPHLDQNFSVAFNLDYTAAEKEFLGDQNFVAQAQFCQQCGQCRSDCPHGVDIPCLMRSHMYEVQYSNRELARSTLAMLAPGKGLDACQDCGECKAFCRNHVNIGNKIAQLREQSSCLLA